MDKTMTQDQRLNFLVEAFKADSGSYQNLTTPKDTSGRQLPQPMQASVTMKPSVFS